MLADERMLKYTNMVNLGFIMSGFLIVADWRRSQAKMTLIKLSCKLHSEEVYYV